ncbi:MAG: ATP-dependent sacrificial sulfur transferase LarE [Candidatus Gastranaerophilales bacterium]|nr:ATP-dependent sacrificial sulfur transferase LarE [Candidatus Gastranaerophilales bacterium]
MFETLKNIKDKNLRNKFSELIQFIQKREKAAVAFSGGIDSTLLAFVSHKISGQNSLIITVNSEFYPVYEHKEAENLAKRYGFNHQFISLSVLDNSEITLNSPVRCKFCKEVILKELIRQAEKQGFKNIFEGSNLDDIKDYRPGFEAVKALGVKSPFMETGFTKSDIRELAKILELPNWNKPASACLASRIPYGTAITGEILQKIEKAEDFIRKMGYDGFRIRHHDKIARIELNQNDLEKFISSHREKVDSELKKQGYSYICLDLNGYKTGSLNEIR